MNRRSLLRTGAAVGAASVAGCLGIFETRSTRAPPMVENRPDAVYVPTHVEGMQMEGMAMKGEYKFALMYSFAHRFWTVTGTEPSKHAIEKDDSMHLMATVWDAETGTVLPDTGLSLEIAQDGEMVSEEVIYPMLSQPMGFHYGGNFSVPGDGTYTANVSVSAMPIRRTGAFADRFDQGANVSIEFDYSEAEKDEIMFRDIPDDEQGTRGAVDPMGMEMVPNSLAPATADLPGRVAGEATSGDGVFVVTILDSPPEGIEADGQYLAVSARTPHNRMILPMMGLSGVLKRGDETVFDGNLARTLDPELNYHYGAVVDSVEAGDELTITVGTPPQVARHEGYETAFLEMPPMTLTL